MTVCGGAMPLDQSAKSTGTSQLQLAEILGVNQGEVSENRTPPGHLHQHPCRLCGGHGWPTGDPGGLQRPGSADHAVRKTGKLSTPFHKYAYVLLACLVSFLMALLGQVPFDAQSKPFSHSSIVGRSRRTEPARRKVYVAVFSSPARQDDLDGCGRMEQRRDCETAGDSP